MGLADKAKTMIFKRYALQYLERIKAWVELQKGGHMVWLKAVGVTFIGGATAACAEVLVNGFVFDEAHLIKLGTTALAGGLIAVAAYLKQSPLEKK